LAAIKEKLYNNGMRWLLILILLASPVQSEEGEVETQSDFLDLRLLERGEKLFQTSPGANGRSYFLIKQIFPSASTSTDNGGIIEPSLQSTTDGSTPNGKFRMFASMGQTIAGGSEDAAHFRLRAGFFVSSTRSRYQVSRIRTRRNPINIRRGQ